MAYIYFAKHIIEDILVSSKGIKIGQTHSAIDGRISRIKPAYPWENKTFFCQN